MMARVFGELQKAAPDFRAIDERIVICDFVFHSSIYFSAKFESLMPRRVLKNVESKKVEFLESLSFVNREDCVGDFSDLTRFSGFCRDHFFVHTFLLSVFDSLNRSARLP
jgi:hypothetical protein